MSVSDVDAIYERATRITGIGMLLDLEARMAISERMSNVVRVSVAQYLLGISEVLGKPVRPPKEWPLYYPGMPAYDAAKRGGTI